MKLLKMKNHVAISCIISFIVILLMILTYPRTNLEAHYIVLPLQKNSTKLAPTDPSSIALYRYLSSGATRLAAINIEQHSDVQNPEMEKTMLAKARKIAAKMGADGLLIKLMGYNQAEGVESGLSGYVMQFVAAKVGPNDVPIFSQIAEPSIAMPQQ
jgi:hypothetical protein